jgi:hypothetical protein
LRDLLARQHDGKPHRRLGSRHAFQKRHSRSSTSR